MKRQLIYLIGLSLLMVSGWGCDKNEDPLAGLDLPDNVAFTHLPIEFSGIQLMEPIGGIRTIPNDHGGFILRNPFVFPATIPIYAMSDGFITNIRKGQQLFPSHDMVSPEIRGKPYDDFALHILVTKTAEIIYGHIPVLSDLVLSQAGTINRSTENRVKIEIKEGDILGYAGPHPAFDIGMYDSMNKNHFANRSRYSEQYMSAVSFTDYMPQELKQQVWTLTPRTIEPRGGTVSVDVDGTLAGNWFVPGDTKMIDWSKQLIFARHHIYADKITISDASPLNDGDGALNKDIDALVYWVRGNKLVPESITPSSGLVKIEVASWWDLLRDPNAKAKGTIAIEMTSDRTLKYEYFENKTAVQVTGFTSEARNFER